MELKMSYPQSRKMPNSKKQEYLIEITVGKASLYLIPIALVFLGLQAIGCPKEAPYFYVCGVLGTVAVVLSLLLGLVGITSKEERPNSIKGLFINAVLGGYTILMWTVYGLGEGCLV